MNRTYLMVIAAALLAAPLAFAHSPAGFPKNFCEQASAGEWLVHDYGPPATGRRVLLNEDGNIGGDCEPGFSFSPGWPCGGIYLDRPLESDPGICGSHLNPPFGDWDGHNEYALGGAWLLAVSGNGVPSADPSVGAGTLYCYGAEGHHANDAWVSVEDVTFGAGASVLLGADTIDMTGLGEGCGDGEDDVFVRCPPTCMAPFSAGLDGSYRVYVEIGTQGHVYTN